MTSAATRVLFDEPGPRGRARIRVFTLLALVLLAGLVALALYQFARSGQLCFPTGTLRSVDLDAAQINAALDDVTKSSDHIRTVIVP